MLDLDPPLYVSLVAWGLFELSLAVRDVVRAKGRRARDRGTRILISFTLNGAVVLAFVSASVASSLRIPGPYTAAGLVVMWLGLTIRVWAVAALGSAFRTSVEVDTGQTVVSRGPYRWVRHPSYTGLILIVAGFGLAAGNWLALAACVVLPLAGLLRRIQVEEAELTRVLGDRYRVYRARTKRLIPGVW
jgi:protein-S-isoprenylcysteine O-methyltransferase Ste14